jgi:serine/threonine-protein kinase
MSSMREVEVADTLPPEERHGGAAGVAPGDGGDGGDRDPTPGAPPRTDLDTRLASWDRYELLGVLGAGGMGIVYRARDRRLGRLVAIKFILGADPNLAMRFLREARAQARIDHANVCRVHEVGEIEGRAYIALQLVEGQPLHRAAAQMSLDDKIAVVRDVAIAVHEAHRLGIVHRDLKPANVLIERRDDGRFVPIVMDFGLAREATVELGLTESGMPLGTPAYMSPEQARGDIRAVDRRSDVYSLGATLYELATGSVPFPDSALATALARVIHDEPPAPRSLVPSLPVDVETIALKCLAKAPTERYPSARALADDLSRYLDGEPIIGRRVSRWRRIRLRARRHRGLVVLGGWSLAVIAVVGSLGIRAWLGSRSERALAEQRTRLAERLGRDAKEIELVLGMAYQLPLHDTRPDRERMRSRMAAIAATSPGLGALGDALVHDALGRGQLAFHHWRAAADQLALAAAAGLDTPELHAARGRALGELYHRELEIARRSGEPTWIAQRERELARQYLTPAVSELEHGRGSGDQAGLLEALLAFYRRDFAGAEQRAQAVADRTPWLVDARKLVADAAYRAALAAFDRGDYDGARQGLERATAHYAAASEVARSDALVYSAVAETWRQRAEIEFRQGRPAGESLQHALDALDRALTADPDDALAYTIRAEVLLRWSRTPALVGTGDRRPLYERTAQAAQRATELDPGDASAWDALANAHIYRGIYESDHGGQAAPWLHQALGDVGKALAIQPSDPAATIDLGFAHRWLGASLAASGGDPLPEYRAAMQSYERAAALDPQYVLACMNQADIQTTIAEYDAAQDTDPRPAVERARRAGEHCLELDRNFYSVLHTLAQAELALVQYLVETGGDPGDALQRARRDLDRADQAQPNSMVTWFYRIVADTAEARHALRSAGDPAHALGDGRAAVARALQLRPDSAYVYAESARLGLVEARWAAHAGRSALPILSAARADADKAIALDPQLADARVTAAEACLELATARRSSAVIESGLGYAEQAIALNPRLPRAIRVRAALTELRDQH